MKDKICMNQYQRDLVEENLSLVYQILGRHIRYNEDICGMSYDDLFQEGACALCRAAMTYDNVERGGVPFSAYARPVIRNYLLDYCRRVLVQLEHLPTVALDASADEDAPFQERYLQAADSPDDWNNRIFVEQILEHGRRSYTGVARLGVVAMVLKTMGYTGADIARLYNTKPNHVGAWISRAAEKLKRDGVADHFLDRKITETAA